MTLSACQKFSYSVGHVLNDLCASMWFTYLLLFFHKTRLRYYRFTHQTHSLEARERKWRERKKREALAAKSKDYLNHNQVLEFSNSMAGNIILIGQLADGLATPLVGYESDRPFIVCKYGRRKTWHLVVSLQMMLYNSSHSKEVLREICSQHQQRQHPKLLDIARRTQNIRLHMLEIIGTFCVAATFPLLFIRCIGCTSETPEYAQFIYYAPLVVIFQFGWASTQINHLALIPDLTHNDGEKITLNALRYAFTVFSSILVYAIAWLVLETPKQSTSVEGSHDVTPEDAPSFMILVLTVVGIGVLFSGIFHFGLKENKERLADEDSLLTNGEKDGLTKDKESPREDTPLITRTNTDVDEFSPSVVHWYDWFKRFDFYQMAMLYMCTRLVVNLSQVYMPMYLTDTLLLHKKFIAIVPLTTYVSSFCAAMLIRPVSVLIKQETIYVIGTLFIVGSCVWGHFIEENSMQIFGQAIFLGFGTSTILVVSLSMVARLIGKESTTCAFVYGALSLTDKISNGVAVVVIQYLNPCLCDCPDCAVYFRNVMTYLLGGITVVAFLTLISIAATKKTHVSASGYQNGAAVTT